MRVHLRTWLLLLVIAVVAALAPPVSAEEFLGLQLHGFGGWYYGRSNHLQFLEAQKGGNAHTAGMALNVSAKPSDRTTVVSQLNFTQSTQGGKVLLDYAFLDYEVGGRLKLRAGRAKHPWGIYGEIYDVGTARPFHHLSQGVYGPVGFTAKAYNGVGITGSVPPLKKWELEYDVYGGEIDGDYEDTGIASGEATKIPQKYSFQSVNKNVAGIRLKVNTPVEGLWVGGSGYTGTENVTGFNVRQKWAYLGSFEYTNSKLLVRGESGYFNAEKEYNGDAMYLELAYKLTPHWQVAARADNFHLEVYSFQNLPFPPWMSFLQPYRPTHSEKIVGVNYWVNPNVVLRASLSNVKGRRLLFPSSAELENYVQTGYWPKNQATVFILATQFSF